MLHHHLASLFSSLLVFCRAPRYLCTGDPFLSTLGCGFRIGFLGHSPCCFQITQFFIMQNIGLLLFDLGWFYFVCLFLVSLMILGEQLFSWTPCLGVVHASHPKQSLNFCSNYDFQELLVGFSAKFRKKPKSFDYSEETSFFFKSLRGAVPTFDASTSSSCPQTLGRLGRI